MRLVALLIGAAVLVLLAFLDLAGQVAGNADDAFILLVYARHFAENGSLHYNVGEGALDGFSSLLDVIVKGVGIRASGADPIEVNFWVTTAALGMSALAGLALAIRAGRDEDRRAWWLTPLGALALALTPGLAEGTSYMLETPLFAFILIAALACIVSERVALVPLHLFALGLVAVRPEGTPIAVLLVCAGVHASYKRCPVRARYLGLTFAGLVLIYYAWRIWLFGHWAPNSYYAKTSAVRSNELRDGWAYVLAHGGTLAGAVLTLFVATGPLVLLSKAWSPGRGRRIYGWISGTAWIALGGVVASGGDCYAGARFLMPSLVLGTVALLMAIIHLESPIRWLLLGVLVLATGAGLQTVMKDAPAKLESLGHGAITRAHFACSDDISSRLAAAARGARVAQIHFQRFKYFQDDAEVFDLTGINERDVAHRPVDGPVRFGKDGLSQALGAGVEVLHLDYRWSHPLPMARHTTRAVVDSRDLRESFAVLIDDEQAEQLAAEYLTASLVGVCGSQCLNVFIRTELAAAFRAAGFLVQKP